jgi:hypothetical protein
MSAIRPVVPGAAGALVLLAAALSGCGSARVSIADAAAPGRAASAGSSPAASAARAATSAGSAGAPSAARAATPAARAAVTPTRPCASADLAIAPAQRHVTHGVQIERFTVTPTTAAGCTLTGAPHVVPKGPLSGQIPNSTVDLALSQQDFPDDLDITPPQPRTIPIAPAKPASFYLAWFAASPVVCVQSTALAFNAPGDSAYPDMRTLTYPLGPICDGVFYVSAVF